MSDRINLNISSENLKFGYEAGVEQYLCLGEVCYFMLQARPLLDSFSRTRRVDVRKNI